MTTYELIVTRFAARPKGKLDRKTANRILRGTNFYIWGSRGKYGWSSGTSTCFPFNTPTAALKDIINQLRR